MVTCPPPVVIPIVARCRRLVIVLLAMTGLMLSGGSSQAEEEANHAGLVIRDQAGELTYAYVAFTEPEISGIELLKRSGVAIVTVGFGGLGEGVCSIQGEGCAVGECRRRLCQGPRPDDPFWQSFRQRSPGDWRPEILGASSAIVRDGDVAGWSWTNGEAQLPAVTLSEVAARAEASVIVEPDQGEFVIDWITYTGAGVILLAIGGGALALGRRHTPSRRIR